MTITVFTHREQKQALAQVLSAISARAHPLDLKFYDTYDDFISSLACDAKDIGHAVIVARHGADGMESARNAKLMCPDIPLVWLSNDEGFGIESYRIGCAFFSTEEITEALMQTALGRCNINGG